MDLAPRTAVRSRAKDYEKDGYGPLCQELVVVMYGIRLFSTFVKSPFSIDFSPQLTINYFSQSNTYMHR
jgi:hypothetical protein